MKRKRMIKLLMAAGIPRNEAVIYADACGPRMSHSLLYLLVTESPRIREVVRPRVPLLLQGLGMKITLEAVHAE